MPEETMLELDQPGENELQYEAVFGSEDTPDEVYYHPVTIQNQGAKYITRMACSRFGMCHAINAQNEYIHQKDGARYFELPAEIYWEQYLMENPSAEKDGATLQSALSQFVGLGFITGYTRVSTINDMKSALNRGRTIYTGSQNGDWVSVRGSKVYKLRSDGRVVGHIFCITGYDRTGWIAINSYGENNGVFHIPFELTDTLYSRYAISDKRDEEILANFR